MNERWWGAFRDAPEQAVADLFDGRAGTGALDVPEMLYQAFPTRMAEDRALLDRALGSWLDQMRKNYATEVKQLDIAVYGKRIGDALIALQLLELSDTRERIRTDVDAWIRWLLPLRLAPERDPALECWRLLTQGQRDGRHIALWLRLAEDPRAEHLTVALAGLARLPNDGNALANQHLTLRALLRHASVNYHDIGAARRFFSRRFAAVQFVFPRAPSHWHQVLNSVLQTSEDAPPELVQTLVGKSKQAANLGIEPVSTEQRNHLEAAITQGQGASDELAERLFNILEQNRAYALATGVSDYFVRTLCNLGHLLLVGHGRLGDDAMVRLGESIDRALVWEPNNPYCWTFWAEWFQHQGHYATERWVLREMVRLFPDSEAAHTELARSLLAQGTGEFDEAEHLLRRPFSVHSDGGHSRVVLARLLRNSGRESEAVALLGAFSERFPENAVVRDVLDTWSASGNSGENLRVTGSSAIAASDDEAMVRRSSKQHAMPLALQELQRRGELGQEFIKAQVARDMSRVPATECIEREARKGDTLAGFYSQWLGLDTTPEPPAHAWGWRACTGWQSGHGDWRGLAAEFPELALETAFLGVLAGDDVDRWRTRYNQRATVVRNPVMDFMATVSMRIDDIGSREREGIALAIMESAATSALEFTSSAAG